jgi:hypothetical protein
MQLLSIILRHFAPADIVSVLRDKQGTLLDAMDESTVFTKAAQLGISRHRHESVSFYQDIDMNQFHSSWD